MAIFEVALAFTLIQEGGYVSDPLDRGSSTNYGVTMATLAYYTGQPQTPDSVKTLTLDTAKALYKKLYWANVKGDLIQRQPVATVLFDMAVLTGPAQAIRMAQAVAGVKADGLLGPVTLAAINGMPSVNFVAKFAQACDAFFDAIVAKDATQNRFLAGWDKRVARFGNLA